MMLLEHHVLVEQHKLHDYNPVVIPGRGWKREFWYCNDIAQIEIPNIYT